MTKSVLILASALCFLSLLGFAYCETPRLFVEGKVYCDTCRAQFVTRVSHYINGSSDHIIIIYMYMSYSDIT